VEIRNLRDLIHSNPPIEQARTSAEERASVALPGDVVAGYDNPYSSHNPQELMRLIRSGTLSFDEERLAREAIKVFEFYSKERVVGGICRSEKSVKTKIPIRVIDEDVLNNADYDPELNDLFR
jgi:hypothetical protein